MLYHILSLIFKRHKLLAYAFFFFFLFFYFLIFGVFWYISIFYIIILTRGGGPGGFDPWGLFHSAFSKVKSRVKIVRFNKKYLGELL